MASPPPRPFSRERTLILGLLLVLAGACWGLLLWHSSGMEDHATGYQVLTMGMGAALFVAMWVVMMVAMMFPTAAPMILTFATVQAGKQQRGQSSVPTWVFVAAYMVVWTLFGVLAYALAVGAERLTAHSGWLMANAARLGGAVLVAAGLYQLSPLKHACLAKCRTPLQFVLGSWREGYGGAFRMGLEHGAYCLGCCWLLFVILFPLGVMNVAAMAVVTALIYAEKSLPASRQISQVAAAALIAYGALVTIMPARLRRAR